MEGINLTINKTMEETYRKFKNTPKEIYLNLGEDFGIEDEIDFKELSEVTWCEDKISPDDIKYVLQPEPIKEITDSDIEKWAEENAFKRWQIHTLSTIEALKGAMIYTAKAYRDGLITGTGKSNKDAIIQKQEELIHAYKISDWLSVDILESELEQLKSAK